MDNNFNAKDERSELVFRMYYTTKDGRRIYRKNGKPFCFRIKRSL